MSKVSLKTYIKKIESKYIVAREKYESVVNKLNVENERYNSIDRALYNVQGLAQIDEEHHKKISEYKNTLVGIANDFKANAGSVTAESDKVFDSIFCYTPKDIDANGMAILEHGGMTTKEIRKLANDYKKQGNNTMYFMCAERLKDSELPEDKAVYGEALMLRRDRPDHSAIDSMIELCSGGLRIETAFSVKLEDGISASDAMHARHDELLQDILSKADAISADVSNPFE